MLVVKRIHVFYRLSAPPHQKEIIERVHRIHAANCPVYRSISKSIDITTEYRLE